jgi:hypothetical protein
MGILMGKAIEPALKITSVLASEALEKKGQLGSRTRVSYKVMGN